MKSIIPSLSSLSLTLFHSRRLSVYPPTYVSSPSAKTLSFFLSFHSVFQHPLIFLFFQFPFLSLLLGKGKAAPLQAWSGPERSRKLRFPDFMKTAQDGGKVVSLTQRPPLPPGNTPGTHFC